MFSQPREQVLLWFPLTERRTTMTHCSRQCRLCWSIRSHGCTITMTYCSTTLVCWENGVTWLNFEASPINTEQPNRFLLCDAMWSNDVINTSVYFRRDDLIPIRQRHRAKYSRVSLILTPLLLSLELQLTPHLIHLLLQDVWRLYCYPWPILTAKNFFQRERAHESNRQKD